MGGENSFSIGSDNLLIVDDEYFGNGNTYSSIANEAHEQWTYFIKIMTSIRENDVIDGETAKKIEEYAKILNEKVGSRLVDTLFKQSREMNNYIGYIDGADQCLF